MFDIGWQELFIIAAIGLIVVGPKDLPRVLSQITKYIRKARGIAREFQSSIDEVVRQADLEEIRKEVEKGASLDLDHDIRNAIDPDGAIARQLDVSDVKADIERSARSVTEGTAPSTSETPAPYGPPPADPANSESR
ncbi:MAG: Sec-independent protein translocase protein TatB [Rhodospirillales bacterium]|jgi:sec-independent protein translocase protein TatB|nr:Sec-independent protein translocase protein TatB [Rhodospirillales bacterium]